MINLLPQQYKKELKLEEKWRTVIVFGFILVIFLLALVLILYSIKIYINGQVESTKLVLSVEEKPLQNEEVKGLKEQIKKSNQVVGQLANFYQQQNRLMPILEEVSKQIPNEINLTKISWSRKNEQVSITGFSSTRENLFELKNNLESNANFSEVVFSSSAWLDPANIDFQVSFKVKIKP